MGCRADSCTRRRSGSLCSVPDEFEQALLDEIADADAVDDGELAADLRIQLAAYRAAKRKSPGEGSQDR